MSEVNAPATLTTPWGSITFNPTSPTTDYYFLTNVTGLDMAPLRTPIDDKPQADGGIIHLFLRGPRHASIEGLIVAQSSFSARNTMTDNLLAALDSIVAADGTWTWQPTGQAPKSITVRCDVPLNYSIGSSPTAPKRFIFGLVAGNPAIA